MKIGDRALVDIGGRGIIDATVVETAPSGKYIRLRDQDNTVKWVGRDIITVLEELPTSSRSELLDMCDRAQDQLVSRHGLATSDVLYLIDKVREVLG